MFSKIKTVMVFIWLPFLVASQDNGKIYSVVSPDKGIIFNLKVGKQLQISASFEGQVLLEPSILAMNLSDRVLGENAEVENIEKASISEIIHPIVKIKEAEISNNCNELRVHFKQGFYLVLRAYNEGFAYRFGTQYDESITILSETGDYRFPENHMVWWGKETQFQSHNQVFYDYQSLRNTKATDLASLPLIINPMHGPKIVITETDLIDYPGMWIQGSGANTISRVSPKYPKTIGALSDRNLPIYERENFIAKTKGSRTFPWRIFVVASDDADLINNQLPFALASSSQIKDPSWIQPGKVSWDWWNANNLFGVDFKAGVNTATYKYYIDFASNYGIENILLDEGWYTLGDLSKVVPEINMVEILDYAKQKGVGVILWCVWKTLDEQFETAFKQFKDWGIKGIKVDFMNRDDQEMVNFYYKIAKKAAENKLFVDFHGSHKPAGIHRMFPNVLTMEGVNGGEEFKWSMHQTPEHDLIIPFGRMLAGPMDYTPGAMINAQQKDYSPIFDTPMSMGTRCHQLAMFVCYESPLQMLCDSPSRYYKEPECMEFMSAVPSVWDETIVLAAEISNYLLLARRNGNEWYVGGMTDWNSRAMEINLSFLPKDTKYTMTLYQDGLNADRIGIDYKQSKLIVDHSFKKSIHLAKGGGVALRLVPVN
ncbi:alpha-glucosidase [Zhouia amylolytica]|uniref:Alpha-glucosidase n=2 Tax=Zhouia amylolytica TaxID=376730 RepID=A0A1I6UDV5_9FLAO|nr:alpha-glucosidase [Zhouia amylolytica]